MLEINYVENLQKKFDEYDSMLNEHISIFPNPDKSDEEEYETILDMVLKEISDLIRRKKLQNTIEVFKISSYVLNLTLLNLPPSYKLRTKLLEILSLCYEFNAKIK